MTYIILHIRKLYTPSSHYYKQNFIFFRYIKQLTYLVYPINFTLFSYNKLCENYSFLIEISNLIL